MKGKELNELTERIAANPKTMLEFMMSNELSLAPVEKSEARRSFLIVAPSTVFGSIIPLIPYIFVGSDIFAGTIISVVFSGIVLFLIGVYEARSTLGSPLRSGLQLTIIGLTAGFVGFLIGHFIGALPI
jgi:predicted membrane protein (TIGR00267 family)